MTKVYLTIKMSDQISGQVAIDRLSKVSTPSTPLMAGLGDPEVAVMEFLESAYGAAADAAKWDRGALERRSR